MSSGSPATSAVKNCPGKSRRGKAPQGLRHVGLLHVPVMKKDPVETFVNRLDLHALLLRNARDLVGLDRQQHDAVVQNPVVIEVVAKRSRNQLRDDREV